MHPKDVTFSLPTTDNANNLLSLVSVLLGWIEGNSRGAAYLKSWRHSRFKMACGPGGGGLAGPTSTIRPMTGAQPAVPTEIMVVCELKGVSLVSLKQLLCPGRTQETSCSSSNSVPASRPASGGADASPVGGNGCGPAAFT